MNDEEREAVEYWKTHMKILHLNTQLASEHYIKVLLDLVEKQSKEIEELKEDSCCMTNCVRRDKEKLFLEDKIKAKIEEIENTGIDVAWEQVNYTIREQDRAKIEVLRSLLEKE